jgi:hypothetical protein
MQTVGAAAKLISCGNTQGGIKSKFNVDFFEFTKRVDNRGKLKLVKCDGEKR